MNKSYQKEIENIKEEGIQDFGKYRKYKYKGSRIIVVGFVLFLIGAGTLFLGEVEWFFSCL